MNFNLMYSNSHITMGTSSDDLFDKSGRNQNSLHFKYNKFLISPYLERKYQNSIFENNKNNEQNNKNTIDIKPYESVGETNIYYPKPNYYNNIYTQRYSKNFKKYYSNYALSNYSPNFSDNYIINNNRKKDIISRNIRLRKGLSLNNANTFDYQIKKEIEIQKTPEKDKNKFYEENKFNNYKRYDDYYLNNNKNGENKQRNISKIAQNNLINSEFKNKNQYFSPIRSYENRRIYS